MTTQRRFFQRPRLWGILCGLTLAVAQLFTGVGMGTAHAATTNCTPNGLTQNCTVTFDYSGAAETWTVPDGVTQATFDLYGAQGGYAPAGGKGGRVMATLTVAPGATYQILVGGNPIAPNRSSPGFNGGGAASTGSGGGGGGAADVRTGAFALANRILVAGGGGGGTSANTSGGAGGYPNGGAGAIGRIEADGGGGGTQTSGGAGGLGGRSNGSAGSLGQGGNGGSGGYSGAGGGGYYGGGGGGVSPSTAGSGGGGGSSFGPSGATFQNGVREGNGQVIISYTQSDTSAPVANPTQSPAPAPSGWNNSNVTVTWNWSDPSTGSGYASGIDPANCTTSSISSGSGTINLTATCKDLAGNTGTATYQVRVDPNAPTANPSQSPAANAAGWNNTDVTVNWNWVFTGAIIDTANCTTSLSSSGEGALTLSATCRDVALNQRTVPYTVKVDKTAPVVTVDNVTDGTTYTLGSVPISGCSTSDALSGVATVATFARSGGNPDGTGSFTITCSGAVDNAGNSAAPVSVSYSVIPADNTAPVITPNVVGTLGTNGWYVSDVTVSWTVVDAESTITSQSGCETQNVTGDTVGVTFTCAANSTGGGSSQSVTIQRDATAPTLTLLDRTPANSNGWNNSPVTMNWRCSDATAGVYYGATIYMSFGWEGADQSTTATCIDMAGNTTSDTQSNLNIDKTKPNISAAATTAPNANGWYNSDVTVQFTCGDYLAGVATCPADQLLSSEGTAVSSTAQTVSDLADNVSDPSNVVTANIDKTAPVVTVTGVSNGASYTLGSVPAAGCTTSDALSGVATQATLSVTGGGGPLGADGTGSFTAICNGAIDLRSNSGSTSISYTVNAVVSDACTTTALRDNFNRANGGLGSQWAGATNQSFYKIASQRVDVQLGGPVVWKPTTFGVNQAAFVTLSTLDANSPSQGVLLKVQAGTLPNAGAIAVVYDSVAKAVRVSTLRLNTPTWTIYGNTPATFANGDKLLGCVQADGTVRVYQNNTLLTAVTLNAADQSFFNAKGGKIGLWTVAALNAFVDDFGGGALTGVTGATLDATVPDELADDGAEITVAVDFPTDDPDTSSVVNRVYLPLVNR